MKETIDESFSYYTIIATISLNNHSCMYMKISLYIHAVNDVLQLLTYVTTIERHIQFTLDYSLLHKILDISYLGNAAYMH